MHQILAYATENHEESALIANISATPESLGPDGALTEKARISVLSQLVNLPRAKDVDGFELQYLAPGDTKLRTECWAFQREASEHDTVTLANGHLLYRHYDVTEEIPHLVI